MISMNDQQARAHIFPTRNVLPSRLNESLWVNTRITLVYYIFSVKESLQVERHRYPRFLVH